MGDECQYACIHGDSAPSDNELVPFICNCHSCYEGGDCTIECSEHGTCNDGTCECDLGWQGEYCDEPDCEPYHLDEDDCLGYV